MFMCRTIILLTYIDAAKSDGLTMHEQGTLCHGFLLDDDKTYILSGPLGSDMTGHLSQNAKLIALLHKAALAYWLEYSPCQFPHTQK